MIAAQFTDPENARIIFFAAGGLLVIAIGVVVATIVWWRSSGIEPTALAPLEVMSTRSWWDGDEDTRREQVEAVRGLADLRAGPPEAGQIVERAGGLSGVSLVGSGAAAGFVDDDVLDDEHDDDDDGDHADGNGHPDGDVVAEPAAPARRGYRRATKAEPELAGLDRLAQLDADPASAAGLFDQFADDPFSDSAPPAPPARPRRAAAQPSAGQAARPPAPDKSSPGRPAPSQPMAKSPIEIEDDLWGGSAAPRRSIDPLLGERDSW